MPSQCETEWFAGQLPIKEAFVGDIQVYPCETAPPPVDGVAGGVWGPWVPTSGTPHFALKDGQPHITFNKDNSHWPVEGGMAREDAVGGFLSDFYKDYAWTMVGMSNAVIQEGLDLIVAALDADNPQPAPCNLTLYGGDAYSPTKRGKCLGAKKQTYGNNWDIRYAENNECLLADNPFNPGYYGFLFSNNDRRTYAYNWESGWGGNSSHSFALVFWTEEQLPGWPKDENEVFSMMMDAYSKNKVSLKELETSRVWRKRMRNE